jgi:hypothetical protein
MHLRDEWREISQETCNRIHVRGQKKSHLSISGTNWNKNQTFVICVEKALYTTEGILFQEELGKRQSSQTGLLCTDRKKER